MVLRTITTELLNSPVVRGSEFLQSLCSSTVALYPDAVPTLPWAGCLAEEEGEIVGTCAFKGRPVSGEVEIAYFTFPGHEGRGVATRMAQSLAELAVRHGVASVRAQTLPERNASVRILEKLGFEFSGPSIHPEDGKVWDWCKRVVV